jgi:hypothetical protein
MTLNDKPPSMSNWIGREQMLQRLQLQRIFTYSVYLIMLNCPPSTSTCIGREQILQ